GEGRLDLGPDLGRRRQLRRPQPVVAHHALLARVRDGALLEGGHVRERPLHPLLHRGRVAVGEGDTAYVQRHPKGAVLVSQALESVPVHLKSSLSVTAPSEALVTSLAYFARAPRVSLGLEGRRARVRARISLASTPR